ncbi:MAG: ComEC/Rec2 family competence protein [Patescibacteria group bacterium]
MGWWFRQLVHSSWGIAVLCATFVIGVWLALLLRVPIWFGVAVLPLVAVSFWHLRVYTIPVLAACGMCIGLGYGSAALGERDAYSHYIGQYIELSGKVKEDPSRNSLGQLSLQLDTVNINDMQFPGSVLVSVPSIDIKRGDIVTVQSTVKAGFGSFPISMSRATIVSVERPVPGDVGRVVRDWFADKVRVSIPEPQASLGIGFLTGQKSALPEGLSDALKVAGLTHIVVASGYNLTILVRMARRLFVKLSKYLAAVSSGVMITLFMAITGLSPSMTRAGLVSGLSLLAWYYGHRFHPLILLPFAAAITVALQPSYVWGDLGWQLSFSAFAGVMILAPLLQRYFYGQKEPGVFRQILGETISAHIVTVPIIAIGFGVISNVAIIANVLVVPLVPLAMLLTFICGMWIIFGLPFVWLIATPTTWLLTYMTNVATFVSELSWAQSEIQLEAWMWGVYVLIVILACLWMTKATKYDLREANPIL